MEEIPGMNIDASQLIDQAISLVMTYAPNYYISGGSVADKPLC
jgi:hypothetical protein